MTKINKTCSKSNISSVNKLDNAKKILLKFNEKLRGKLRLPINFFYTDEFISNYICILNKTTRYHHFIETKNITFYKDKNNNIFILINRSGRWEDTILYKDIIDDSLLTYSLIFMKNH